MMATPFPWSADTTRDRSFASRMPGAVVRDEALVKSCMLMPMDAAGAVGWPLWVRLAEWEVVDGEVEEPTPGSVLRAMAVSVDGRCEPLEADALEGGPPKGVVAVDDPPFSGPRIPEYIVTGMVVQAGDVVADYGGGPTHVGAELLLQVNDWRLYAQVEGWASELNPRSRFPVRVRGHLHFVASYALDAFDLVDIRADWSVVGVARLPDGDSLVGIQRLQTRPVAV